MRGSQAGALERTYLHSGITEGLWYAVAEIERLRDAKLSHALMLAALYGNPSAKLDDGNDQVHDMYLDALRTMPYIKAATLRHRKDGDDGLVDEWRRVNEEESRRKAADAAERVKEGVDG